MTYKDIMKRLPEFKGRFYITKEGEIRAKPQYDTKGYCPLAAISVSINGENTCNVPGAAPGVIRRIMTAADRHHVMFTQTRKDLLKALGLKEKP